MEGPRDDIRRIWDDFHIENSRLKKTPPPGPHAYPCTSPYIYISVYVTLRCLNINFKGIRRWFEVDLNWFSNWKLKVEEESIRVSSFIFVYITMYCFSLVYQQKICVICNNIHDIWCDIHIFHFHGIFQTQDIENLMESILFGWEFYKFSIGNFLNYWFWNI